MENNRLEFKQLEVNNTDDIDEYYKLTMELFKEHENTKLGSNDTYIKNYNMDNCLKSITKEGKHSYLIKKQGETIGILSMDFGESDLSILYGNVNKLSKIYICDKHRKKGYTHQIIEFIKNYH